MFMHRRLVPSPPGLILCGLMAISIPLNGSPPATPAALSATPERLDLLTGRYWRRVADPLRPAAPPRLVEADRPGSAESHITWVRAGDHLLLQAEGAHSLISMDAIALESVAAGDRVRVRLEVTGAVGEAVMINQTSGHLLSRAAGADSAQWKHSILLQEWR
jgi:hypothetical protein